MIFLYHIKNILCQGVISVFNDFLSLIIYHIPFETIFQVLVLIAISLLILSFLETILCVYRAMYFKVDMIHNFRKHYFACARLPVARQNITLKSCRFYWIHWLQVSMSAFSFRFARFHGKAFLKKVLTILLNIIRFVCTLLLANVYMLLVLLSLFERAFRAVLTYVGLVIFLIAARIKVVIMYHKSSNIISISSGNSNLDCPSSIIFQKPILKILLQNPNTVSDVEQKNNLNRFTVSMKNLLQKTKPVKYKVHVKYTGGIEGIKRDLPMTLGILKSNFRKIAFESEVAS